MDSGEEKRFQFLITPLKPADKGKPKACKDMKKTRNNFQTNIQCFSSKNAVSTYKGKYTNMGSIECGTGTG